MKVARRKVCACERVGEGLERRDTKWVLKGLGLRIAVRLREEMTLD